MELFFSVINVLGHVILVTSATLAFLLIVRVIIAWATSNPFLWLPYQLRRVTEPLVRPFRQPFSGYYMRFDLLPAVAAVTILLTGWFLADTIWRINAVFMGFRSAALIGILTPRAAGALTVILVGTLYEAAIFMRFVLPWLGVSYASAILRFLFRITEPLLKRLRRLLSGFGSFGMFDFTPLLAILLVRVATMGLASLLD